MVSLFTAASDCAANRLVSCTIVPSRCSSKKCENISSGSLLLGTWGPTGMVHGSTVTGEGVMVHPMWI